MTRSELRTQKILKMIEYVTSLFTFYCFWRDSLQWARASSFTRFIDHTQRRTTLGTTPLDEW